MFCHLMLQLVDPADIDAGSKIRSVVRRRLDLMVKMILEKGWKDSTIRLMPKPGQAGKYICLDGMHRVTAMQKLTRTESKYKNFKFYAVVYPEIGEFDQCIMADGIIHTD